MKVKMILIMMIQLFQYWIYFQIKEKLIHNTYIIMFTWIQLIYI